MVSANSGRQAILLPYQRRWVDDKTQLKVWVASRQIGKSFALSLEAVHEAMQSRSDNLILSSSQRQAQEVMAKVIKHLRVMGAYSDGKLLPVRQRVEDLELANGSRIISLPANPDTVRGFSGNVYLDEFAFHADSRQIWRAMYPSITRGYKARVTSTPNGRRNMFYDLATGQGGLGAAQMVARHRTNIYEAVSDGLEVDVARLRTGIADPEAWAQEYECRFVDRATALISYEQIEACESLDARAAGLLDKPGISIAGDAEVYLGFDIGRRHDLSVIWLLERVGDVLWTRMVRVMRGIPFAAQRDALYEVMDMAGGTAIRRAAIDSTGIGSQLSEEARQRYGHRVEPVTFTQAAKEDMALRTMRAFEERSVRIPQDREIRDDLHSIERSVTSGGHIRYSAARGRSGHGDRFWALALAISAAHSGAGAPVSYAPLQSRSRAQGTQRGW